MVTFAHLYETALHKMSIAVDRGSCLRLLFGANCKVRMDTGALPQHAHLT